jgi:hypothetical protein
MILRSRSSQLLIVLALAVLAAGGHLWAQTAVVQASREDAALTQAYRSMYNLNFEEAFRQAEAAKIIAKDDPLPWVAEACAVLFREFDRLHILRSEMFSSDEALILARPRPGNQHQEPNLSRRLLERKNLRKLGWPATETMWTRYLPLLLPMVFGPTMPL